jgi:hypothetical protein
MMLRKMQAERDKEKKKADKQKIEAEAEKEILMQKLFEAEQRVKELQAKN